MRFCFRGLLMTTSRAFSMPMRFGSRYAPPQPGMIPRNTSGRAIAAAEASTVRYVEFSAISSPPPRARPLTKAKEGTPSSPSDPSTLCPSCATRRALSFEPTRVMSERSAPAARMYCLPVMPTAWISPAPARALRLASVAPSSVSVAGPSVLGRVWSRPLSSVMSARILPEGRVMSRTREWVTTSPSASAVRGEKSISS